MSDTLAIHGGPKSVTNPEPIAAASRWPVFGEEEQEAVRSVLERGGSYEENGLFEQEFAAFTGSRYALAHNNGTSAIHAAYFAAGVQPGDEVITSAYTWHLQVSQILALHGIPVFCDIDPHTACIDPAEIEHKISPRTRAIAVLHPFGCVAPMEEIMAIAHRHNLKVIEDCSHAHGATYKGRPVGTIGDVGCYSLQASKLMTAIEGGILVTNDTECYERACLLGHYERIPRLQERYRRYYDPAQTMAPTCFGYKYRMNPLAAAIARVQLRHLPERTKVLRQNMCQLSDALRDLSPAFRPPPEAHGTERVWLNYICEYDADRTGIPRQRFIDALIAEGVPASHGRPGYLPVYWNPLYEDRSMWAPGYPFDAPYTTRRVEYPRGLCPIAEARAPREVGLPVLRHACDPAVIAQIAAGVGKVLRNLKAL
jgi:dTDP-4-amino-4,6-dideoxygalactose transaminase